MQWVIEDRSCVQYSFDVQGDTVNCTVLLCHSVKCDTVWSTKQLHRIQHYKANAQSITLQSSIVQNTTSQSSIAQNTTLQSSTVVHNTTLPSSIVQNTDQYKTLK